MLGVFTVTAGSFKNNYVLLSLLYNDVLLILIKNYARCELNNFGDIHACSRHRNTRRKSALDAKLLL
jgi:hypothetical protein